MKIYSVLKRTMDIAGSLCGLLILSPMLLLIALLIRLTMGSPVLFTQARSGLNGRPFKIVKYRSMLNKTTHDGQPIPLAARVTRLGRRLRSTSLDEVPELWNVLKGEMSLVGPRPLFIEYNDSYDDFQRRRLDVKPGLTGWAQINGRATVTWDQKFSYDVWYVEHRSLWLDFKIIWLTLVKVVSREGVSAPGAGSNTRFDAEVRARKSSAASEQC